MFSILRNTFSTSRSGLAARSTVSLDEQEHEAWLPVTTETPESLLLDQFDQALLQEAIEKLPVAFREVLLLCDVEEMSYQEISETLAIPMGTVMSRLARARRAVRESVRQKAQKV